MGLFQDSRSLCGRDLVMQFSAFKRMNDAARTLKNAARDSIAYAVACHGIACAKELMGADSKFCIRGAYQHRTEVSYFDDTSLTDEYQLEVYLRAAEIAHSENAKTVYDVGCGSGYK